MAQQLIVLTALAEVSSSIHSLHVRRLTTAVTPAPGNLALSSDTHTQLAHIHT